MAIAAVAVITLLGMLGQGVDTVTNAGDRLIYGRIHQQVVSEVQAAGDVSEDNLERFLRSEYSDGIVSFDVEGEREDNEDFITYQARVSVLSALGHISVGSIPASLGEGATTPGYEFSDVADRDSNLVTVFVEVVDAAGGVEADFSDARVFSSIVRARINSEE